MKYFILALFWIIWCTIHSAMISLSATGYLKKRLGSYFSYYRLFFNIFAVVTIISLVLYAYSLQEQPIFLWNGYYRMLQISLLLIVVFLFFAGSRHYNSLYFLGIQQIREGTSHKALTDSGELDTTGILGVMRHPWYTAAIAFIWTRPLDITIIIINIILSFYLIIGTFLEERKLFLEFGESYREYQKKVSMFIPYKWVKAKIKHRFFTDLPAKELQV